MNNAVSERPLVSFPIFAYNQEVYIRDAVGAAFAQTYSPLEIILSDDCSSDRTFAIMQEMAAAYKGPHKVVLNRNERNLGIVPHCNKIMQMATGRFFVMAAGDDVSLPERVEEVIRAWNRWPFAKAVRSQCITIDQGGRELKRPAVKASGLDHATRIAVAKNMPCYHGAVMCYSREVFDFFGPILDKCWGEDVVLGYRARLLGEVITLGEPLVRYRIFGGTSTTCNVTLEKSLEARARRLAWLEQLSIDVDKVVSCGKVDAVEGRALQTFFAERLSLGRLFYSLSSEKLFSMRLAAFREMARRDSKSLRVLTNWLELLPLGVKKCLLYVRGKTLNIYRGRLKS